MGTGICLFFGWENGISCTGTGIHQQQNNRKWEWDYVRFEQDSHCDDGICALGQWDLVKIWAGKWEYDPPFRTLSVTNWLVGP
jgi:hypothetical protein